MIGPTRLSWADRSLFAEAMFQLGVARMLVACVPFKTFSSRLGKVQAETTRDDDAGLGDLLKRVRWAILAASRRAPWRCKCLEQSIAARRMLRRRGVSTTLYLGVARTDSGLDAHAWLRCGSFFVAGGDGSSRFAVVSTFGD